MVEKKTAAEGSETKAKAPKKTGSAAPAAKAADNAPAKAQGKSEQAKSAQAKPAKSGGTVTLEQVGSPIGRQGYQRATLIGLGLNKLHRTRTLEDTPSVRGMIAKVQHLIRIVE